MAKFIVENKTQNKIWLYTYCFVPGVTETQDLTEDEEKEIRKRLDAPTNKERIKNGVLIFKEATKNKKDKPEATPLEIPEGK